MNSSMTPAPPCGAGNPLPLVSVVMPSLNQGRFIREAIESVLGQSHGNLELIVADGGSTDETRVVVKELQGLDARLKWFSGQDSGPSNAINRALVRARGTLIGWLNSDDRYAPGAVAQAVAAFAANPLWLMLYGHGQHIDAEGKPLGRYPTLPPSTPVHDFGNGCFICQPTVFFRRSMSLLLGKLDEELVTAFDFDYWLRAFLAFRQRIGFVDSELAYSRLHGGCRTQRLRRTVAVEGMKVLARHLGEAPGTWVLSHVEEFLAQYRSVEDWQTPRAYVDDLQREAQGFMSEAEGRWLAERLSMDARLRLATHEVFVAVYADGWAGPELPVCVRPRNTAANLLLHCRFEPTQQRRMSAQVVTAAGEPVVEVVDVTGFFDVKIPLASGAAPSPRCFTVRTDAFFVPSLVMPGATDTRQLAFRVEGVELI